MKNASANNIPIYQAKSGAIQFRGDFARDTIWGSLNQIAELFGVQPAAISKHFTKIYQSGELDKNSTLSILEIVQTEGRRRVTRNITHYNLDAILSVGYRVNSKQATQFRIWATQTLKRHLLDGYTIDRNRIGQNYAQFLRAVSDVKALLPSGGEVAAGDVLELVRAFAGTWFSLDAYDKDQLPKTGASKRRITFAAAELREALAELKKDLLRKKQATELFARERKAGNLAGIAVI